MGEFRPAKCPPGCKYQMAISGSGEEMTRHCGYILIADQMRGCDPGPGCSRYTKGGRTHQYRVRQKRGYSWDERMGFRMYLDGKTDRQIADALGVRRELVGETRRKHWVFERANGARP